MFPPPPRRLKVRAYWDALWENPWCTKIGLWFGVFPFVLSLVLFTSFKSISPPHKHDANTISTQGTETTGEIIRIDTNRFVSINHVHPQKIFFQYKANGIQKITSMDTVSSIEIADWKPGHQVSIRYLDDEATIPSIEPLENALPGMGFSLISSIGLLFLVYSCFRAHIRLGILKNGEVRTAQLVGLASSPWQGSLYRSLISRKQTDRVATYSYTGKNGKTFTNSSRTRDTLFLNEHNEIKVLVLPDKESASVLLDGPALATFAEY